MSELVKRLHDAENLCNQWGFSGSARAIFDARKRITELEAQQQSYDAMIDLLKEQHAIDRERLADSNEALQVMGLKLAHAEGHSANTVGGPTPVMDAAPACEQTSWADQLITKDTAHQIAFAVKYEAEERAPHVAGTFEGIRLQGAMDACDEIMELIEGARVANHQATFQSGHECVSRVSNSDSQMNKQDDTRTAGESDR